MKTRLLSVILFFFVSISTSLAQGHENSNSAGRTDPLPGTPEPIYPPGCIPPPVPVVSYYVSNGQTIPGLIGWKATSGAIGYRVLLSRPGSTTANTYAIVDASAPHPYGVYMCLYSTLPLGTYIFYVEAFNSGCSSNFSKPFTITLYGDPVPQTIDPGNDPYALDLDDLLDYNKGDNEEEDRVATSPATVNSKPANDEAAVTGVYPNPVGGTLNVSLPAGFCSGAKFLVHDVNGRAVDLPVSRSLEGSTQFDTSGISPGIYFISVIAEHINFRQKFIKK